MSNAATVNPNLPVKTGDDFVGELETMDLSELKGKRYLVGVNTGDRSGPKYVCSTLRGEFTFEEMCEAVGYMWKEHQHHAKVMVANKDFTAKPVVLDENTVDYIEAHFQDIITESMLDGVFDEDKDYTCRAGLAEGSNEDNPLAPENAKKVEVSTEDEDDL